MPLIRSISELVVTRIFLCAKERRPTEILNRELLAAQTKGELTSRRAHEDNRSTRDFAQKWSADGEGGGREGAGAEIYSRRTNFLAPAEDVETISHLRHHYHLFNARLFRQEIVSIGLDAESW